MKLYPRLSVILPAGLLIALMLRLSWWQHTRYQEKLRLIAKLQARMVEPVMPLESILTESPESLSYRRVTVTGQYDFAHEMVLRNRRYEGVPGVHVLTPLQLETMQPPEGSSIATSQINTLPRHVLVSRGFIPLSYASREQRAPLQRPPETTVTAIIKPTAKKSFLAPSDPPSGSVYPWIDAWLRVDIPKMAAQLPYPILPFYLEEIPADKIDTLSLSIVQSHSEREEMLSMASNRPVAVRPELDATIFPIAAPNTIVPAGRHRQYVYEWIILAFLTSIGALIMMLRPGSKAPPKN
jgi:cytochrome oxidase assembly protein ShyY1